ncbi:DUF5010 domain-containing protein [Streptomyces flaveolus]|uniref:DUF5010 domain-containing protein n=1 Tax=Streptomyces flaveolus TaxID=67297 RepID=UPI0033FCDD90
MSAHSSYRRLSRWFMSGIAAALAISAIAGQVVLRPTPASAATAAATPVVDNGGTVLPVRAAGQTGALGVTFGFEPNTLTGSDYTNQGNTIHNLPMFKPTADRADYWEAYVEQLVTAGVDYVAVDIRGFIPGSAMPNGGGDPRILNELVDAIEKRGVQDQLKIAALDDTPASLVDKKNLVKHGKGGYVPAFDLGDATGEGEGGYQYFWDNNLKAFFDAVPGEFLYKVDGKPLIFEWSIGSPLFTNQGNGNAKRMLEYAAARSQEEFGFKPAFVLDQTWPRLDPQSMSQAYGQDNWFSMNDGGKSLATFDPDVANNDMVSQDGNWSTSTGRNIGDYDNDVLYTTKAGATATYTFTGTGVAYLSELNNDEGNADVYLDDVFQTNVNLNSTTGRKSQQVVFQRSGLTNGTHTIKVVNKTTKVGMIDAFQITTGATHPPVTVGVAVPGFRFVDSDTNMVIEPEHGATLQNNLQATVNAGKADITLVEGFTDWPENAALFRAKEGSYSERLYDYPNQNINIMRRFSKDPFPARLKIEAESADAYQDRTPGNTYTSYRDGDIDVQKESRDAGGGWNVGGIDDGEWLQWQEVGMQGTKDLKVRVATPNSTAQLRFVIDGVAGPTVTVPTTGDWHAYQTVDAGTFSFEPGAAHTVRLEVLHGGFNLNWWSAETGTTATPAPTAPTGPITGYGGKCVDDADSSTADRNPIQLWTCNGNAGQRWTVVQDDGTIRSLGKCMDVANAGTGNGTVVQLYTCNGTAAQKWIYDPAGRTLRNPQSGRCLDATGPSSADGTRLQIWDCAYTANQQWNLPG